MGLFDRFKEAQQAASAAVSNAGGIGGAVSGMMPTAEDAKYAQAANKLGKSGVQAPGSIVTMRDTGKSDLGGGKKYQVDVTITPDGGAAYNTTITQSFLPAQLEGLSDGKAITVKYDPDNPSSALIYGW
jgi:hypothetical protein